MPNKPESKATPKPSVKKFISLLAIVLPASILGWIASGIVHELGHALVVLSLAGKITKFQPFLLIGAPHIAYTGSFTTIQKAVISMSGAGMVYLIVLLVLILFPYKRTKPQISLAITFGMMPFAAQLLSYVFLPILDTFGISLRDDVINFINFSHLPPLLISFTVFLLVMLVGFLVLKRARIVSMIQTVTDT